MVHEEMRSSEYEEFVWEDREYKRGDNYYVRIIQMDNQIAWINPMHFAAGSVWPSSERELNARKIEMV